MLGPALFTHGQAGRVFQELMSPSSSPSGSILQPVTDPRPLRQVLCWLPEFPRGPGARVEFHSPTAVTVWRAHSSVTPLPSLSHFSPLPGFSRIASQIYSTHYNLCLRVRCWGAPNQENGVSPRVALRSQNLKVSFAYDEPVFAVNFRP